METLYRPEIFTLITEVDRQARDALTSFIWVPRVATIVYEENQFGWPATVRSNTTRPKAGPIDWKAILRYKKSLASELDLGDLPALRQLCTAFVSDPEYAKRFDPITRDLEGEMGRRMAETRAIILASEVMSRAECDPGAEGLKQAFAQLERGALSPQLSFDVVAPLLLTSIEGSLDLGGGVTVKPMTEDFQRARAHDVLGSRINAYLAAAATHAVVLRNQTLDNLRGASLQVIQLNDESLNLDLVDRACQAIEISTKRTTGYGPVYLRPHGWATGWDADLPAIERAMTVHRYPSWFDQPLWNQQRELFRIPDHAEVQVIYKQLIGDNLRARLASERLSRSSRRTETADILLDACIGIEALVGQGRDELVHRMSQRAAVALSAYSGSSRLSNSHAVYSLLKKVYDQRSRLVHGGNLSRDQISFQGTDFSTVGTARMILRELLRAHVLASPPWSPEALDQILLDALNRPDTTPLLPDDSTHEGSGTMTS
jgi:Apea-like HEPN